MSINNKKILTIDGGGIRGAIALGVLSKLENKIRDMTGNPDMCLAEFYDFIAGTSTGGIIAAALSIGMTVDEIKPFYLSRGKKMFERASITKRFYHKYNDASLSKELEAVFGEKTTLGSDKIKTILMLIMRNASTGSPWPVTNNINAMFNQRDADDCNLDLPLWQLVRASTAAPSFFPPEKIKLGAREFLFVDGALTPYNNPSFMSFLTATSEAYKIQWPTGEDAMLLTSVGTGDVPDGSINLKAKNMHLGYTAIETPAALIHSTSVEQDTLCRMFGACVYGDEIDMELGDLQQQAGPVSPKLFTYTRYNPDLSEKGLAKIGCSKYKAEDLWKLDAVDKVDALFEVGIAAGEKMVKSEHLAKFTP